MRTMRAWTYIVLLLLVAALNSAPMPARAQATPGWLQAAGGSENEQAAGVVVNAGGEVYAAGAFRGTVDFDPGPGTAILSSIPSAGYIVKYTPQGAVAWAKPIQGTDDVVVTDLGIGPDGSLVVTGNFKDKVDLDPSGPFTPDFSSRGSSDLFVARLDADGSLIWGFVNGGSGSDSANGVFVRSDGQVYVTGNFEGVMRFDPKPAIGADNAQSADEDDVIILRFFGDGALQWAKVVGGDDDDEGRAMVVDKDGTSFTAGVFEDDIDLDPAYAAFEFSSSGRQDVFITKLIDGGDWRAGVKIGGLNDEQIWDMAIDSRGDLYVVGSFEGTVDFDLGSERGVAVALGDDDVFLAKYTRDLQFLWVNTFGSGRSDIGHGITLDNVGSIYITGNFEGSVDFDAGPGSYILTSTGEDDGFIAKYFANGALDRAVAVTGAADQAGRDVTADRSGNIYATGIFAEAMSVVLEAQTESRAGNGGEDFFVARYSRDQWTPGFSQTYLPLTVGGAVSD